MNPGPHFRLTLFSLLAFLVAGCGTEVPLCTLEEVDQAGQVNSTSYFLGDRDNDGFDEIYLADRVKGRICFSDHFLKTREFTLDFLGSVAGLADLNGDGQAALGIARGIPRERVWISFFDLSASTYPPNPDPIVEIEGFRNPGYDFRPEHDWHCSLSLCGMADFDGDGCDDLVVKVQTSYELIPRGIWIYDGKSLQEGGSADVLCYFRMAGTPEVVIIGDMDGGKDGKPEIVVKAGAPDNWTTHEKPDDWPVERTDDRPRVLFLEYDEKQRSLVEKQCWESKQKIEPLDLLVGPEMPVGGRYFYLLWPARTRGGNVGKIERINGRTRQSDSTRWFEKRVFFSLSRFDPSAEFQGMVISRTDGQVELLDENLICLNSVRLLPSQAIFPRFVADLDCNGNDELVATTGNSLAVLSLPGLEFLSSRTFPVKPASVFPRQNGKNPCDLCVSYPSVKPPTGEGDSREYVDLTAYHMVPQAAPVSSGKDWFYAFLLFCGGVGAGAAAVSLIRRRENPDPAESIDARCRQKFLDVLRSVGHGKITSSILSQLRMILGHLHHDPGGGSGLDERMDELVSGFRGIAWPQLNRVPPAARAAGVSPAVLTRYEAALGGLQEAMIHSDPAKTGSFPVPSGTIVKSIDDLSACRQTMLEEQKAHFRCDPVEVAEGVLRAALPDARKMNVVIEPLQARIGPGVRAFARERDLDIILEDLVAIAFRAVKNSPEKRVALIVDSSGERVVVDVCDTGPGIGDERKNRIFDRDYPPREIGSKLGLFQVAEILDRYGGRIFVAATEPGKGTTIRTELKPI